jgi:hypothetical protein
LKTVLMFRRAFVLVALFACGRSDTDSLDGIAARTDAVVERKTDDGVLRLRLAVDGTPRSSTSKPSDCPDLDLAFSIDGAPTTRTHRGGVSETRSQGCNHEEVTDYSCGPLYVDAMKPPSRETTFVLDDGSATWTIAVVETPIDAPPVFTREGSGPVGPGDEVRVRVSPVPAGIIRTTVLVDDVGVPARWVDDAVLAFTMPAVQPGEATIEITLATETIPRVTRCEGPRACRLDDWIVSPGRLDFAATIIVRPR